MFEVSLADLQEDDGAERSFRKFKLIAEDVKGRNVLTNFHGMDLTTDKLRSMVKKWQTLIEANVDVKTTDGYLLRVFCIGFTSKDQSSTRKTCYAQHTQVKTFKLTYFCFYTLFTESMQLGGNQNFFIATYSHTLHILHHKINLQSLCDERIYL